MASSWISDPKPWSTLSEGIRSTGTALPTGDNDARRPKPLAIRAKGYHDDYPTGGQAIHESRNVPPSMHSLPEPVPAQFPSCALSYEKLKRSCAIRLAHRTNHRARSRQI